METKNNFVRPPAIKISIKESLSFEYVQENEKEPNYILGSNKEKIYRINIIGIVLSIEKIGSITNVLLEDGTGNIILRSFEENKKIKELEPGEIIQIIGRLRKYNQERYISPEIITKVNPLWLKIRIKEMGLESKVKETKEIELIPLSVENKLKISNTNKVEIPEIEEEIIEEVKESEMLPTQKILSLIKEIDKGEGAPIEEIVSKSPLKDTEQIIDKMLEKGDIFQNLPGKVKVL